MCADEVAINRRMANDSPQVNLTFNDVTRDAIERKDALDGFKDSPQYAALMEGVEQYKLQLTRQVIYGEASSEGVYYERLLSQIRGLDALPGILDGIVEHGRKAEAEMRLLEGKMSQ